MKLHNLLLSTTLVLALCGCAATSTPQSSDPVRKQVLSELAQAHAVGSVPGTEKQFIYPHWPELAARAGGNSAAQHD